MEALDNHWNIISVFILVGLVQNVLLFCLFINKKSYQQHRFFLFFLVVLFYLQLEAFLIRSGYLLDLLVLMNTSVPFLFLLGPLLLFYTRDTIEQVLLKWKDSLHLLPFLFYLGYSFCFFLQAPTFKHNAFLRSFYPGSPLLPFEPSFSSDPWNIQGWVVVEMIALHLLIYALFSISDIRQSFQKKKLDPALKHWLQNLMVLFLGGSLVLLLSQGGVVNGARFFPNVLPAFIPDIWGTITAYLITLYLGWNTDLFKLKRPKYQKSKLPEPLLERKSTTLRSLIESERLFLESDFSLEMLSQKSGIPKHQISQILNEAWHCNFFELAHHYRINEAKRILQEADNYIKLEQLAYDLGYKSKTTFFNAFKKATNLTPAKFRHQVSLSK